jgi:hypothetical protein
MDEGYTPGGGRGSMTEVHFHTSQQPNGPAFNLTAALLRFDLADAAFPTRQTFAHRVVSGFCCFVLPAIISFIRI